MSAKTPTISRSDVDISPTAAARPESDAAAILSVLVQRQVERERRLDVLDAENVGGHGESDDAADERIDLVEHAACDVNSALALAGRLLGEQVAARGDTAAVDDVAALLGTSGEWENYRAMLGSVARIVEGAGRPPVGDATRAQDYRSAFRVATGRTLREVWATEPFGMGEDEASEEYAGGFDLGRYGNACELPERSEAVRDFVSGLRDGLNAATDHAGHVAAACRKPVQDERERRALEKLPTASPEELAVLVDALAAPGEDCVAYMQRSGSERASRN